MKYSKELLKDIVGWDIKNWSRAIRAWDRILHGNSGAGYALETGAREGGISLYLAMKGYRVTCTDLDSPHATAGPIHEKHRVSERVRYAAADATKLPFEDGSFDLVGFKSVLGSVGRQNQFDLQRVAVMEAHRVLRPGGYLLFAENLSSTRLHMALREKFNRWGHYYRYMNLDEFHEIVKPFELCHHECFGFASVLGRAEWQRSSLHYVDKVLDPVIPKSWKYLIYGYARK